MKAYILWNLADQRDMTLNEIKEIRDRFWVWTTSQPQLGICGLTYGVKGQAVYRIGVTYLEEDGQWPLIRIPENDQGIFGPGLDLSKVETQDFAEVQVNHT